MKHLVYIDGTDWQYEIGRAADGNTVYPDPECLKKKGRCWEGCGIVECELVFKRWAVEHDWKKMSESSTNYSTEELKNNGNIIQLESAKKRLEYLENIIA